MCEQHKNTFLIFVPFGQCPFGKHCECKICSTIPLQRSHQQQQLHTYNCILPNIRWILVFFCLCYCLRHCHQCHHCFRSFEHQPKLCAYIDVMLLHCHRIMTICLCCKCSVLCYKQHQYLCVRMLGIFSLWA